VVFLEFPLNDGSGRDSLVVNLHEQLMNQQTCHEPVIHQTAPNLGWSSADDAAPAELGLRFRIGSNAMAVLKTCDTTRDTRRHPTVRVTIADAADMAGPMS
jgi:hypothetical protein